MHSKRVGAINLYKATANFAVYNLQNEAKENSPHSASLDVTVRTDTERCKFEDKRSKKMDKKMDLNEDFLFEIVNRLFRIEKLLERLVVKECPGSICSDGVNYIFKKEEDK